MPEIPKGAKKPSDRLAAESAALDIDGPVAYEFKGATFLVLPFLDWDKSAISAINRLDFDVWAAGAMTPEDAARFANTKATARETLVFVKEVAASGGAELGELLAS